MKTLLKIALLALATSATSALAADKVSYGWCEVEVTPGTYQMSALLQAPSGPSSPMERAFGAEMGADRSGSCWMYYASPSEAKSHFEQRQYVIRGDEKKAFNLTGWTGPYAVTGAPAKTEAGPYLTVEKAEKPVQRAKASEVLSELAKLRNSNKADTQRANAENKRKAEAFRAEQKKRGRAQ